MSIYHVLSSFASLETLNVHIVEPVNMSTYPGRPLDKVLMEM